MTDSISSTPEAAETSSGRYTVIARRYRPQAFDELVGQEHVARALQQAISSDRVGHAYLFTGARGVGKTSAARILAKALNCEKGPTPNPCNECDVCLRVTSGDDVDVLEIDGASNNGVDEVRQLRQNASVMPSRERYKIYIIDEVHMLSKSAFNALLKTLEEPPAHVKFIFATTESHKIPITILSRCQRFDFAGISAASIQDRLAKIAATEGVEVDADALQIIASRAAGSMRDSQSLLEQLLSAGHRQITAANVNELLGIAPAERLSGLVRHLVARDAAAALAELDATIESGVEAGLLLDQLVGYFRDIMTAIVGCPPDQMLYAPPAQAAEVAAIGEQLGLANVLATAQILDHTSARMRVSVHGRTLVEMALVRICQLGELEELATLIAEMRGEVVEKPRVEAPRAVRTAPPVDRERPTPPPAPEVAPAPPVKKNDEAPPSLAAGLTSAFAAVVAAPPMRVVPPVAVPVAAQVVAPKAAEPAAKAPELPTPEMLAPEMAISKEPAAVVESAPPAEPVAEVAEPAAPVVSVLAQYHLAVKEGIVPQVSAAPPRASRREQLAQVAEQPFVRRAMELFDVAAGQFRYVPPEGESN